MVEASLLELPFKEREVLELMKGMNKDKVLGSDGFSMAFFLPKPLGGDQN